MIISQPQFLPIARAAKTITQPSAIEINAGTSGPGPAASPLARVIDELNEIAAVTSIAKNVQATP